MCFQHLQLIKQNIIIRVVHAKELALATSMLVADVGDSFCQGQVGHVGDRLRYLRPI